MQYETADNIIVTLKMQRIEKQPNPVKLLSLLFIEQKKFKLEEGAGHFHRNSERNLELLMEAVWNLMDHHLAPEFSYCF